MPAEASLLYIVHSMSKDGTSKDGRKMSPLHVTLKAGVNQPANNIEKAILYCQFIFLHLGKIHIY